MESPKEKSTDAYKLSFTFGGLLIQESVSIAGAYIEMSDWQRVREAVMGENILQKTRSKSRTRYFREIRDRLKHAYDWELEAMVHKELESQRLILFLILCRYYRFIRDFYLEVVRSKLKAVDFTLEEYEYPAFVDGKTEGHPELNRISETTKKKLQQVTLRILREAGMLVKTKGKLRLQPPIIPEEIKRLYTEHRAEEELRIITI